MHRAPIAAPRTAAVRAAAARRGLLVALLVLVAFLGMSLEAGTASASDAELPPVSAPRDAGSEGQHDTAESEQAAPGRTEREARARVQPLSHFKPYGTDQASYVARCAPAGQPAPAPGASRCVVLRC
ncbi:hypothetical protein ACIOJD_18025 [Streptomyces sp. NPDC088116]|uniref:hypothetical protein n=1 Tax=Streptomyces sp. NPDC088116 TaxID=3365825 RepID=UPI003802D9C4